MSKDKGLGLERLDIHEGHTEWGNEKMRVQLFGEADKLQRLTVTRFDNRPLSWETLQAVKRECGFSHYQAVEMYPPHGQEVSTPARHLWLVPHYLAIGWGYDAEGGLSVPELLKENHELKKAVIKLESELKWVEGQPKKDGSFLVVWERGGSLGRFKVKKRRGQMVLSYQAGIGWLNAPADVRITHHMPLHKLPPLSES